MIHVVHILASSGMGGMESHVRDLCEALSRDYKITVIAPAWLREKLDARIHFVGFNDLLKYRYNLFVVFKLKKILKELEPDIVHVHGSKSAAMIMFPFLFKNYRRVATVHGIKSNVVLYNSFDHLIAVSPLVQARLLEGRGSRLSDKEVSVILNGVMSGPNCPRHQSKGSLFTILAVGRLVWVKGFDVLLTALARIDDARLRIAGEGPERSRLEKQIKALGLSDRVTLLGHRTDVLKLLADSDLLVISSRREGMPLVFAEALHVGCPVVSTAVGGMATLLPASAMVPPENVEALASKINEAVLNIEVFRREQSQLVEFARTQMTVPVMAEKTLEVYKKVLRLLL